MGKYRVARFWFDVEASSPEHAADQTRNLPHTAGWISPDPSSRYAATADPLLAEAALLLDDWATVASEPIVGLIERSHETAARLRQRLGQDN